MKIRYLALAVAAIGSAGSWAADEPIKAERIEVTGSNIKRISKETVSPVTTISREEIARSGATNTVELMRKLTSAGGNGGETLTANSFRNGATSVNLRQLPTLVLLNGYRLPSSGSDEYSGQTSVDLNTIPLAAIERVEVLKDGGSAIYGTDAVGGVVNFILRKNVTGLELSAYAGATTEGDGETARASLAGGLGGSSSGFNLTYTVSAEERKAVHAADRDWARGPDFRDRPWGLHVGNVYGSKGSDPGTLSTGGSQRMWDPECAAEHRQPYPDAPEWFAAPNRNACMYAPADSEDLLHPYKRYSAIALANWDVSDSLSLFGQFFFNHYDTRLVASPAWIQDRDRANVLLVPASNPFNTYGTNVRVRRLFQADEGGGKSQVDTGWLVAGAKGQIGSWDWIVAAGHSQEKGDIRTYGTFLHDKLQSYLDQGKYNPFGGNHNSPQIIRELTADHAVRTKSETDFVNAKTSTEFGELPGGPIGVAFGAEFKRDKLSYDPTQAWRNGEIGIYSVLRGIDGSQSQKAVFGELSLPILSNLEAQLAARFDDYELAGSTTNPKLGIRWTPTKSLLVRANYSTGFRAPTLSQTFNEGRGGFAAARDPKRCLQDNDYFSQSCDGSVLSVVTGTKDIKPEKSTNFNVGFVFEPVRDVSLGVTYWRILWKDRIASLDSETVLAGEDGAYRASVIRSAINDLDIAAYNALTPAERAAMGPLVGRLKEIRVGLINRSRMLTDGYDFDASVGWRAGQYGKFRLYTEATYLRRQNRTLTPDDPEVNCDGNQACDAGEFQTPRVQAKLGLNWENGAWQFGTAANYVSSYRVSRLPSDTINIYYDQYGEGAKVGSSTQADLTVGYTGFKRLTLRAGVDNVFDRDPPFYSGSSLGYDSAYGNPRGRFVYGSLSYQFN